MSEDRINDEEEELNESAYEFWASEPGPSCAQKRRNSPKRNAKIISLKAPRNSQLIPCTYCNEYIEACDSGTHIFAKHLEEFGSSPFRCPMCSKKEFAQLSGLLYHLSICRKTKQREPVATQNLSPFHHPVLLKPMACIFCTAVCRTAYSLDSHLREHHVLEMSLIRRYRVKFIVHPFGCKSCKANFATPMHLARHWIEFKAYCDPVLITPPRSYYGDILRKRSALTDESMLMVHHLGKFQKSRSMRELCRSIYCPLCKTSSYSSMYTLFQHLTTNHYKDVHRFKTMCNACEVIYDDVIDLSIHIEEQSAHTINRSDCCMMGVSLLLDGDQYSPQRPYSNKAMHKANYSALSRSNMRRSIIGKVQATKKVHMGLDLNKTSDSAIPGLLPQDSMKQEIKEEDLDEFFGLEENLRVNEMNMEEGDIYGDVHNDAIEEYSVSHGDPNVPSTSRSTYSTSEKTLTKNKRSYSMKTEEIYSNIDCGSKPVVPVSLFVDTMKSEIKKEEEDINEVDYITPVLEVKEEDPDVNYDKFNNDSNVYEASSHQQNNDAGSSTSITTPNRSQKRSLSTAEDWNRRRKTTRFTEKSKIKEDGNQQSIDIKSELIDEDVSLFVSLCHDHSYYVHPLKEEADDAV